MTSPSDPTDRMPETIAPPDNNRFYLAILSLTPPPVYPLPDGRDAVVGRVDADLCLDHGTVSRRHARLRLDADLTVEDLGSSNGTWVNGRRLAPGEPALVGAGAVIEFGAVLALVHRGARIGGFLHDPGARRPDAPPLPPRTDPIARVVERLAPSNLSILVTGETGVGKGRLAREIHDRSRRARMPFVAVNCAAIPETLFESELFGHERGSFTGAAQTKAGLLEAAHGGTMFLDEVAELPMAMQAKLLHVLERGEVQRVGATTPRPLDVRYLAATNGDIDSSIRTARFRADLYYRLNGATIRIPPLRERPALLATLALDLLAEAATEEGRGSMSLAPAAQAALERYPWPGNVRELRNVVRRAVLMAAGTTVTEADLGLEPVSDLHAFESEADAVRHALETCAGNQTRAAKMLGISRQTLVDRLNRYGLPRPRKSGG